MANFPTFGGKAVLDPSKLMQTKQEFFPVDFVGKANSYSCPLGYKPGIGWLLMLRRDLDALDLNAAHTLEWESDNDTLTVNNMYVARSPIAMSNSFVGDNKAAYLVQIADKRIILNLSAANKIYNIRKPHLPSVTGTDRFYSDSLNSGSLWTWQTLLDDLWSELPAAIAGTSPSLSSTPDGTPEGFRLIGLSALEAHHVVLDRAQMRLKYDPSADSFSIVSLGTSQSGLDSAVTDLEKRLIYDFDPLDVRSARVPEKIRVLFAKVDEYYQEQTTTELPETYISADAHNEDIATNDANAITGTFLSVWNELPAVIAEDGTVSNSTDVTNRAQEVADNLTLVLQDGERPYKKVYSGIDTSVMPGSEITSITWRDFGQGEGLVTEHCRTDLPHKHGSPASMGTPDLIRALALTIDSRTKILEGQLDEDLNTGSNATMSIHDSSGDTTDNIEVYDNKMPASKKIASGAFVTAYWSYVNERWEVIASDTCFVDQ